MMIPIQRIPWLRHPERIKGRRGWRPKKFTAADRAYASAQRKLAGLFCRVAMAKGRFESALGNKAAPELLELALCRTGELDLLLKQLVRLARGSWRRPRANTSRRSTPPVIVIPASPSSKRRRRRARAN